MRTLAAIPFVVVSFAMGLFSPLLDNFNYTDFEFYFSHALFPCPCLPAAALAKKSLEKYKLIGMQPSQIVEVLGAPDRTLDAPGLHYKVWCYEKLNICASVDDGKCVNMRALHIYFH